MNRAQFAIWEKQKWREYESELAKLQEDHASRGLSMSGIRNKAERDLKTKYESEIEITRLGIDDTNTGGTNLYQEILKWSHGKISFTETELFNTFTKLNADEMRTWYLNTFRGASNNDDCLIGVYDDKKGSFFYALTAKGQSAYSEGETLRGNSQITGINYSSISGNLVIGNGSLITFHEPSNKQGKESDWFNKISNHPIISAVIASSIMLVIIYIIFQFTGEDLNNLK